MKRSEFIPFTLGLRDLKKQVDADTWKLIEPHVEEIIELVSLHDKEYNDETRAHFRGRLFDGDFDNESKKIGQINRVIAGESTRNVFLNAKPVNEDDQEYWDYVHLYGSEEEREKAADYFDVSPSAFDETYAQFYELDERGKDWDEWHEIDEANNYNENNAVFKVRDWLTTHTYDYAITGVELLGVKIEFDEIGPNGDRSHSYFIVKDDGKIYNSNDEELTAAAMDAYDDDPDMQASIKAFRAKWY